jgi:NAD-dependent deacetylase
MPSSNQSRTVSLSLDERLFVLTGAGISAESGLATFRGSGGLWNGYRVEEVATPDAWHADPALVWRFYSMRRRDALAAQPNVGHLALAAIERSLTPSGSFYLCTQNVDDLHERGGSQRIHHMHGTLFQSRCVRPDCELAKAPFADQSLYEFESERDLPACTTCGRPIRPHIVWFGEIPLDMDGIYRELDRATTLLVVGTSGSVYPAAGLVNIANRARIRTIYIGPEEPLNAHAFDEILLGAATQVLPTLVPA